MVTSSAFVSLAGGGGMVEDKFASHLQLMQVLVVVVVVELMV